MEMGQRRSDHGVAAALFRLAVILAVLANTAPLSALPIVDPGLFVILGVRTCGGGGGYCLLGSDCTLDRDFAADDTGHCEGLRAAFTPAAHFSCCKYVERSNTTLPGEPADTTTTEDPLALPTTTIQDLQDQAENVIEKESDQQSVKETLKEPIKESVKEPVKESIKEPAKESVRFPEGPASGQTVVAVSDEYEVKDSVDGEVEEPPETAEVVAVAAVDKEVVLQSPECRSPSADVNPCWRSSFLDRRGITLCSGTLIGVDAVATTAVCASRIMEAGPDGVSLRVEDLSLPVRDMTVHQDYRGGHDDSNDIAVVRLLLAGGGPGPGMAPAPGLVTTPSPSPSPSCIACLPPSAANTTLIFGKTCFALAARLNGMGVETSAVCAGRVAAAQGVNLANLKLSGCEVASIKSPISLGESQSQAVRAREGAALLCDGALTGLASTQSGSYSSLNQHLQWLLRALAAPRTSAFHV